MWALQAQAHIKGERRESILVTIVREEEFRATAFQSKFGSLSWRSDCWCYLQGLKNVARKTARVNPDLIDVDLVRGLFSSLCFMIDCWKLSHENWWFLKKMSFLLRACLSACPSVCLYLSVCLWTSTSYVESYHLANLAQHSVKQPWLYRTASCCPVEHFDMLSHAYRHNWFWWAII